MAFNIVLRRSDGILDIDDEDEPEVMETRGGEAAETEIDPESPTPQVPSEEDTVLVINLDPESPAPQVPPTPPSAVEVAVEATVEVAVEATATVGAEAVGAEAVGAEAVEDDEADTLSHMLALAHARDPSSFLGFAAIAASSSTASSTAALPPPSFPSEIAYSGIRRRRKRNQDAMDGHRHLSMMPSPPLAIPKAWTADAMDDHQHLSMMPSPPLAIPEAWTASAAPPAPPASPALQGTPALPLLETHSSA